MTNKIRLWTVTVAETLDDGKRMNKDYRVQADDVVAAIDAVHAKLDEQQEHRHRYEVVGAGLAHEADVP